jgi:hypothetical protein
VRTLVLGLFVAAALAALGAVVATRGNGPQSAGASSHREAPLISEDPTADNTDLYAFVSPDKPDTALQVVARSTWLDFNTLGYGMVALFVLTWSVSAVIWKTRRIEERWSAATISR